MENEIKEELKKILGEDAFSNGNMQVSERVQKLTKSVNYLVTQLKITSNLNDDIERKNHVTDVINNLKNILNH